MARKLRVGFVGLGRVFDLNVQGYLDHPEAEVSALCDGDPAILARRAAEYPGAHATCEFQNFLRCDLDLIEILAPHPAARGDDGGGASRRLTCQRAEANGDDPARMRSNDRGRRRKRKASKSVRELCFLPTTGQSPRVAP